MTAEQLNTVLLSLLSVMATVAGILFWRIINKMDAKIDGWLQEHLGCRERQIREFVRANDFEAWKASRNELWKRINRHSHDDKGRVVITDE